MRYLSICSGIEAATVAWHPIGGQPVAFAEFEKFPSAVLAHHYPDVPNLGDITKFQEWPDFDIDILVGGTPCQSFSVAGLRKGLRDPRGNLALTFLAIADRYQPEWVVWENVPGVLSSHGGRDFGAFLGALAKLGYGWAYRTLDAQYFGVPQRRRRVFVVGHLGDWRRAAAVLFERESLRGDPAPRREARQEVAAPAGDSAALGVDFQNCASTGDVSGTLMSEAQKKGGQAGLGIIAPAAQFAYGGNNQRGPIDVATAVNASASASASGRQDFESETFVTSVTGQTTHALDTCNNGKGSSEDGTGRGVPTIAFSSKDHGGDALEDTSPTLRAMGHHGSHANAGGQVAVAFHENQRAEISLSETHGSLKAGGGKPGQGYPAIAIQERAVCENPDAGPGGAGFRSDGTSYTLEARQVPQAVATNMQVRRLTPTECERLQGFPDDYTAIPWRKKPADQCPDGPRYKALGNSMAVPVMRWIGERIQKQLSTHLPNQEHHPMPTTQLSITVDLDPDEVKSLLKTITSRLEAAPSAQAAAVVQTEKAAKAAAEAPANEPPETKPAKKEKPAAKAEATYDDAKKAILDLSSDKGREAAVAVLAKFGAGKLPEVDESKYAEVVAEAQAAMV